MKNRTDPPIHQFIAFSIQEKNRTIEKLVTCNNCGVVHRILEVCRSEILNNFEGTNSSLTMEDIALQLKESVRDILESYKKELPDYEHINFMIQEECIGDFIVLSQEFNDGRKSGKILKYKGKGKFEIEPFSRSEVIE
tara:strand:+ start:177 stop:590 length:414 start_codon:yes stop_codon:yes gene_type:complete